MFMPFGFVVLPRFAFSGIEYRFMFTEESLYSLPGEEWRDWLKGGGVRSHLWNNLQNSLMWAFRRNIEDDAFDLTAYAHIHGGPPRKGWGKDEVFHRLNLNEVGYARIYPENKYDWTIEIGSEKGAAQDTVTFKKFDIVGRVEPWAGGNLPAQHDWSFFMECRKYRPEGLEKL